MKKLFFLFTIWGNCINLGYGQQTSPHLSVGLSFYPNQSIKSGYLSIFRDYADGSSSSTEESRLAFAFGAYLAYSLTNHWEIQSGLLFDDKGYKIEEEYNRTGIGAGKEIYNIHINYLSVPLKAMYKFGQKRTRFFVASGISTDFFLNTSGNGGEDFYMETNFSTIGFSHIISFGGEWALNEKVRLSLEPNIRYALSNYSSENAFKPGSIGIILGFAYTL